MKGKAKPDTVRGAEYPAHGIRFCVTAAPAKTRKRLHPKPDVAFNMSRCDKKDTRLHALTKFEAEKISLQMAMSIIWCR